MEQISDRQFRRSVRPRIVTLFSKAQELKTIDEGHTEVLLVVRSSRDVQSELKWWSSSKTLDWMPEDLSKADCYDEMRVLTARIPQQLHDKVDVRSQNNDQPSDENAGDNVGDDAYYGPAINLLKSLIPNTDTQTQEVQEQEHDTKVDGESLAAVSEGEGTTTKTGPRKRLLSATDFDGVAEALVLNHYLERRQ